MFCAQFDADVAVAIAIAIAIAIAGRFWDCSRCLSFREDFIFRNEYGYCPHLIAPYTQIVGKSPG